MELTASLLADLHALSSTERAVFVLRDVLGWDPDDVAQLLDMPLDSVNCALLRARAAVGGATPAQARTPNLQQSPGAG